jgi:hypothetical protein
MVDFLSATPLTPDSIKGKLDFFKFKHEDGTKDTLFFDREVIGLVEGENNSVYPVWKDLSPLDPDRVEIYKKYKTKFYSAAVVDSHLAALSSKVYQLMHHKLMDKLILRRSTTNDIDIASRKESLVVEFRGVLEAACYSVTKRALSTGDEIHAAVYQEIANWMNKRSAGNKQTLGIPSDQYFDVTKKYVPDHAIISSRTWTAQGGTVDAYPISAGELPFSVGFPTNTNVMYSSKVPTAAILANNEIFNHCSGKVSDASQGFRVSLMFGDPNDNMNANYIFKIRVGYVDEGHSQFGDVKALSLDHSIEERSNAGYNYPPPSTVEGWRYGARAIASSDLDSTDCASLVTNNSSKSSLWYTTGYVPWGNSFAAIIGPIDDLSDHTFRINKGAGAVLTTADMAEGIESMKPMVSDPVHLVKLDTLVEGLRGGPKSYNAAWLTTQVNLKHSASDYLGTSNPPEGWNKFSTTVVSDSLPDGTSQPCTMIDIGNYCNTIDRNIDFALLPLMSPPQTTKTVSSTYILEYDLDSTSIRYRNTVTNTVMTWAEVSAALPDGQQLGLDLTAYELTPEEVVTYGGKLKWLEGVHPVDYENYYSSRRVVGNNGNYSDSTAMDRFNLRSYQDALVGMNHVQAYTAEARTMMILTSSSEMIGFAKSVFTGAGGYSKT